MKLAKLPLSKFTVDVPAIPASAILNELSDNFLTIYELVVDNPWIAVVSAEYSTISPLLNPWFTKFIVLNEVDIPAGFTFNLRCVYPEPSSITLTAINVFLFSVLNLWIPLAAVSVDKPTVLIPALPARASFLLLNMRTVDGLTTLTK